MARIPNNNHVQNQFFINMADHPQYDPGGNPHGPGDNFGYPAFGKVVSGMKVVDLIANTPTKTFTDPNTGAADVPIKPVIIHAIKMVTLLPNY